MFKSLAGVLCVSILLSIAASPAPAVEGTFLVTGDTHYGYVPGVETLNQAAIADMNALPGTAYSGGGTVSTPGLVAHVGDVTNRWQSGTYQAPDVSWGRFLADFGSDGTDGVLNYPVAEIMGNHDYENDFRSGFGAYIYPRVEARHGGRFYSVNVGGLHIAMLDLWPDSEVRAWLAADLAVLPENTPVVLMHHDSPDGGEGFVGDPNYYLLDADEDAYYATIEDYNIIGIFHGHWHTVDHTTWNDLDVFKSGSPNNDTTMGGSESFLVAHVTNDTLTVDEWMIDTNTWGMHFETAITVPEPVSILLLGVGALAVLRRRRPA